PPNARPRSAVPPDRLRPVRRVHHDRAGEGPRGHPDEGRVMAQKQSILGRIAQLTKANINALLDKAEDPQKMLDQLVRDYTNSIAEAEQAVAQTIGNLRLAEA